MKSARLLLPPILVMVVAVAGACGSPIPQAKFNGVSVGMALSAGDRGDQGLNGLSAGGLDRAKHRLGTRIKLAYLNMQGDDRSRALDNLLAAHSNPVIVLGDHYTEELTAAAAEHPATTFAVMDSATPTAPNITNLTFAEEQGSFLMGIAAALKTETHKLGFVGGFDDERTRRYEAGFVAGAQSVDADILVTSRYIAPERSRAAIDARNSPTQARTLAEQMLRQGVDVIYQAAGNSGSGVFDALVTARSQGMRDVWAIGSDQDQWLTATEDQKRVILTSMVKQYDNVAYNFIRDYSDHKVHPGTYQATLADHGLSFTLSGGFLVKYKIDDDLRRAEQAIAAGQIRVPATLSR